MISTVSKINIQNINKLVIINMQIKALSVKRSITKTISSILLLLYFFFLGAAQTPV